MNDLARVQNLLLDASDILFKLAGEADAPKKIAHNNRPKLTKRDVLVIRSMKRNGVKQADIADAFDVNPGTISRIVRGHYWG